MLESLIVYLVLGCFAGFIAGLLGVGGGLIIVPILALVLRSQGVDESVVMHVALGTSLATIVLTSISSVWAHHQKGAVVWPVVGWLAPGLAAGAVIGAWVAHGISTEGLQSFFGIFEITVALYMFFGAPKPLGGEWQRPKGGELLGAGATIGSVSSLLGIGGGTMTVPYLSWRGLVIQRAVAVSAACGLPIALAGSLGYLWSGWGIAKLPAYTSGYLYWPAFVGIVAMSLFFAPIGAKMAHSLPIQTLKRVFSLMLLGMGVSMLIFQ